jgi:hypothetical protein
VGGTAVQNGAAHVSALSDCRRPLSRWAAGGYPGRAPLATGVPSAISANGGRLAAHRVLRSIIAGGPADWATLASYGQATSYRCGCRTLTGSMLRCMSAAEPPTDAIAADAGGRPGDRGVRPVWAATCIHRRRAPFCALGSHCTVSVISATAFRRTGINRPGRGAAHTASLDRQFDVAPRCIAVGDLRFCFATAASRPCRSAPRSMSPGCGRSRNGGRQGSC